jgi:hypothetical protein
MTLWQQLSEERNVIIHGKWYIEEHSNELFRAGNDRDLFKEIMPKYREKRYSLAELKDLFDRIQACTKDIARIVVPLLVAQLRERMQSAASR